MGSDFAVTDVTELKLQLVQNVLLGMRLPPFGVKCVTGSKALPVQAGLGVEGKSRFPLAPFGRVSE